MPELISAPPREMLYRATYPGIRLRATGTEPGEPTDPGGPAEPPEPEFLVGHFATFDRWTEINSMFEGNFMERIAPGAFARTMKNNRDGMRVLFQHGRDPQVGDKPLGPITDLREDDIGAAYEVRMLDTSYNRDLIPGLREGLYGASFRFSVLREEFNMEPGVSDINPAGIPERTIQEARVSEFGPVTFPAYADATAGIRSMTDEFILSRFKDNPDRVRELLGFGAAIPTGAPTDGPEATHSSSVARGAKAQLVVRRNPNRQRGVRS
jgi:HK97 family phage prohead protease